MKTDFTLEDLGAICLLRPHTPEASVFIRKRLSDNFWSYIMVAVEHPYVRETIENIENAGWTVCQIVRKPQIPSEAD